MYDSYTVKKISYCLKENLTHTITLQEMLTNHNELRFQTINALNLQEQILRIIFVYY